VCERHVASKAVWFGVAFAVKVFNRLANARPCYGSHMRRRWRLLVPKAILID